MGSKQVRLDADVYAKIEDKKRDDETFSEAIDRLTSEWSLAEWAGWMSEEEAANHREQLEKIETEDRSEIGELLDRMDVDVE